MDRAAYSRNRFRRFLFRAGLVLAGITAAAALTLAPGENAIPIGAAPPAPPPTCATTHFTVAISSATVPVGTYVPVTVTAYDANPAVTACYAGAVTLTSTDPLATFSSVNPNPGPAIAPPYAFVPGTDAGAHVFYAKFQTPGFQTITAGDGSNTGTSPAVPINAVLFATGLDHFDFSNGFTQTSNVGATTQQTLTIQLSNSLMLTSAALASGFDTNSGGPGDFSVGTPSCGTPSGGVQNCTLAVTFQPARPGLRQAPLDIRASDGKDYFLGLSGVGAGGALAFTPGIINAVKTFTAAGQNLQGGVVDSAGTQTLVDFGLGKVYQLTSSGTLTTIAGGGTNALSTLPAAATSVTLSGTFGIARDSANNIYIADENDNVVLKYDRNTQKLFNVAGTIGGVGGYQGDGGAATSALLSAPTNIAVDGSGNIYIADHGNHVVRKVDGATGLISTYAGTGTAGQPINNTPATANPLSVPVGLALDTAGDLYVADQGNHQVYRIDTRGNLTIFAGNGTAANSGDGSLANAAGVTLNLPQNLAMDTAGDLYISDNVANVVRRIDATAGNNASPGVIHTVAGGGVPAAGIGDGGAATDASLSSPAGVWVDSVGTLYIADSGDKELRSIAVSLGHINDYKSSLAGIASSPQSLLISNVGNLDFNLNAFSFGGTNSGDFSQDTGSTTCAGSLTQGQSCTYGVVFTPGAVGARSGSLAVMNSSSAGNASATLTGTGVQVSISPASAVLTSTGVGVAGTAQTFTVTNPSSSQSVSFGAGAAVASDARFSVSNDTCSSTTLASSSSCTVQVTYTPTSIAGVSGQTLTVTDSANPTTQTASLAGAIVVAPTSMTVNAGDGQTARVATTFGTQLQVLVNGSGGTPAPNITVTFTAPGSGASGTFADTGTATTTAVSDVNGLATAAAFTANPTAGSSYAITATATKDGQGGTISSPTATFHETNTGASSPIGTAIATPYTVVFSFTGSTSVADIQVLTEGAANKDFTLHSDSTNPANCLTNHTYAAGQFCTVKADFNPRAPGARHGAVVLYGGTAPPLTPVKNVAIVGTGTGPAITFFDAASPATSTVIATSSLAHGIRMDAAGNLFYIQGTSTVDELASGASSPTVINSSLSNLQDIAVDGAGNLFLTENSSTLGKIVEIPRNNDGSFASLATTLVSGSTNIKSPYGIAVDGNGTVYYSEDSTNKRISVLPPPYTSHATLTVSGITLSNPKGLALDNSGNLYVADPGQSTPAIIKIAIAGGAASAVATSGITLQSPSAVAADAAGDFYITDQGSGASPQAAVYEVPAGSNNNSTLSRSAGVTTGLSNLALDASGNLYLPLSNNTISKLDLADVPSFPTFPSTVADNSSGPETVTAANIGNTSLTFSSVVLADTTNYSSSTTCSGALTSGSGCALNATFKPEAANAALTSTITVTDDALNAAPATQTLSLSGSSTSAAATTLSVTATPASVASGTGFNFTVTALDADGDTATGYTGTVTFTSTDSSNLLPANYTFVAGDNGVHNFTTSSGGQAALKLVGTQMLTATDTVTGTINGTSSGILVTPGAAAKLVITTQPNSSYQSAAPISVAATVEDAAGNVVTTDTSAVAIAFGTNAGPGTLSGTVSVNAVAGVATFSGLSVDKVGTGYTLKTTDGTLTPATSNAF
ncbi:MAG TPA: choice-of-anchor D domain-containing protein, partial [Terriglobales bacterium]|nr:choice-of-anchor D domain-containing protein [Terriglobales bacterium]